MTMSVPTTGRMIPSGLIVHQQRYRPRDSIYIIDYDSVPTTGLTIVRLLGIYIIDG